MTVNKNPYHNFSKFVLRTPILSFGYYQKLTEQDIVSSDVLKKVYRDPLVREACFLASPQLYFELEKWLKGELETKKTLKIQYSLLKYLTRMSTRCTPFGLFAGCSLGKFDEYTSMSIGEASVHNRHTRLDMNFLVALTQDLSKKKEIREQLLFFPNSSIYVSGNQLRYIEYYYVESRRQHHIVEVDNSDYLREILKKAKGGAYLRDVVSLLIADGIEKEEADNFLNELLDSQILVSELEPSVSGPELLKQILQVLKKIQQSTNEIEYLQNIQTKLQILDDTIGNSPKSYLALSDFIKSYPTPSEIKYLFQTDLELRTTQNEISLEIIESLKKGMTLLNKLTPPNSESNLSKFKAAFQERYEEREMPLSVVLDVETGIGYLQGIGSGDVNPLIDDIILPYKEDPYEKIELTQNTVHRVLEEKLILCDKKDDNKIVLTDEDFPDLPLNWEDLPDTISAMIQIIPEGDGEKIKFSGVGGSSAANLLGRFCHGDKLLNNFAQEIADMEKQMNPNIVLAEIVHLPEARVGNVLMRPSFRDYEIPYLAKSSLDFENQILIEDLLISIKKNRIVLRSKKLNKEIVPHLTNAHNYSSNALPIYQFLCDMQTQNQRDAIYFNYGFLENNRNFLPRVEYENLILRQAKWRIKKENIQVLLTNDKDSKTFLEEVRSLCSRLKLPKYALLSDGDNELLVNFENMTSVEMLIQSVKNRPEFWLTEFLFINEGVVKSENSYHTHQIVVSFFNNKKLQSQNSFNE